MRAALVCRNVVRVRQHHFAVAVVVLHRDLNGCRVISVRALIRKIERLGVKCDFVLVHAFHEGNDAPFVIKLPDKRLFLRSVIGNRYRDAPV